MAVSAETTTQLYQFFAIAFNAAPGTTYMGQLTEAVDAGMSVKDIVNVFTTKSQFTSVYPTTLSTTEFATNLVNKVVGTSATDAAKAEAVANIESALGAGWSRGDVIFQVFSNLAGKAADDATWGNTSKLMANQVAVAQYATEVKQLSTANLADLQAVIANVTATTDVSTPAAIQTVYDAATRPAGQTFTLTTTAETKVLTSGNDTVTGSVANSLEGDTIVDASSTDADVLNATITANITSGTSVTGVETVNITDTYGSKTVALDKFTGVKELTLATTYGFSETVDKLDGSKVAALTAGANVTTLNATNVTSNAVVNASAALTTLSLSGKTANTDTATVNLAGGTLSLANGGTALKTLNLVSSSAANTATLGAGLVTTAGTVNVSGNKNLTLSGSALTFASVGNGVTNSLTDSATLTVNLTSVGTAADISAVKANSFTVAASATVATAGNTTFAAGTTSLTINKADTMTSSVGYAAAGSATTDVLNLTLNKSQANIYTSGFETVNVTNATGSALGLTTLGGSAAGQTFNMLGDKSVAIATLNLGNVDASGLTGSAALTVSAAAATGGNTITATGNADTISVTAATQAVTIYAGAGNDTITSGSGADTIVAGDGSDTIAITGTTSAGHYVLAGAGDDAVTVGTGASVGATSAEIINLGDGNNSVTFAGSGWDQNDMLIGGTGSDTLYLGATTGYTATFASSPTSFVGFEKIEMTGSNNAATSITLADKSTSGAFTFKMNLTTGTGATTFDASADTDTVFTVIGGGTANSTAAGDLIKTGALADSITWSVGSSDNVTISGGAGADTITVTEAATSGSTYFVTIQEKTKGDSGTITSVTGAISTATFDVITGLSHTSASSGWGDKIDTGTSDTLTVIGTGTVGAVAFANDAAYAITGAYNSTTKSFVAQNGVAGGTDTLLVWDADTTAGISYQAVVIVGQVASGNTMTSGVYTV